MPIFIPFVAPYGPARSKTINMIVHHGLISSRCGWHTGTVRKMETGTPDHQKLMHSVGPFRSPAPLNNLGNFHFISGEGKKVRY
jgi:hypothetical protein